jgi:hypothetical protein
MLTQEQNLIFQSYFSTVLMVELKNNDFLNSEYFKAMKFGSPWIKELLKDIKIDNQGALLITLYAMLVIPRQLIQDEFKKEYSAIDDFLRQNTSDTKTTYDSDKTSIKYLRHIRNAVAHSRVSFQPNNFVEFSDEAYNKITKITEQFSTRLQLTRVGEFIHQLQEIHLEYIRRLQKST